MILGMTDMLLLGLAVILWQMKNWSEVDLTEPALKITDKLFRAPKLDRRIDEWLGE